CGQVATIFFADAGFFDSGVTLPSSSISSPKAMFSAVTFSMPSSWNRGSLPRRRAESPVHFSSPDRKSTRLNSSHVKISYAVFCLKKKNIVQLGDLPGEAALLQVIHGPLALGVMAQLLAIIGRGIFQYRVQRAVLA